MSTPTPTPALSIWESAIQELKRLLDDLAAVRAEGSPRAAKSSGRPIAEPTPLPSSFPAQQPVVPARLDRPRPSISPLIAAPASSPELNRGSVEPKPTQNDGNPVSSGFFSLKHASAIAAALAGTGVFGSGMVEAIRKRIDQAPTEHGLLAIALVVGLLVAFFAFKFILWQVHCHHAGASLGGRSLAPWGQILTTKQVLSLIVVVAGALAAGAGGTMIYNQSEPTQAKLTTAAQGASQTALAGQATAPSAAPLSRAWVYGLTAAGLLAAFLGLFVLHRKSGTTLVASGNAPTPVSLRPTSTSEEPEALHLEAPTGGPSLGDAAEVPTSASPPLEPIDQPETRSYTPGDPVAILLDHETTFTRLRDLFDLDSFSCNVLFLTVACEADSGVAARCAHLQGGSPFPSAGLAVALFAAPVTDGLTTLPGASESNASGAHAAKVAALAADAPLRAWRLIETFQPDGRGLLGATLKADEPILQFLLGHPSRDERLQRFRAPLAPDAAAGRIAGSQWALAGALAPRLGNGELCELRGRDPVSKQLVALAGHGWARGERTGPAAALEAHARGKETLDRVACSSLPKEQDDIALAAKLWQRQSRLLGGGIYVDAEDAETPEQFSALRLFLRCLTVPHTGGRISPASAPRVFVATYEALPDLGLPQSSFVVSKPERSEQEALWLELVKDPDTAAQLADDFDFNLPTIVRLHRVAQDATTPGDVATVRNTCRQSHQTRLDALAQRIVPVADWESLVLPPFQENLLRALADQVRCRGRVYRKFGFAETMNRGFGISALFTGGSGTGKTTAAEVIAGDLGFDLYRVDLSAVVDKYIGETEKKLRRVFDAAEEGAVALLIDECDAIFGRRSEVKDSHDRYANIQTDYLLQRLESFRGLVILATNQGDAIDQAFLRRLRFIVNFPMPDRALRREIWKRAFPEPFTREVGCEPPFDDDLWDTLAETRLSGGQIHAIALNAAFLAARENPPRLTLRMIEHAMDAEFLKTGNPVRHTTFPAPPEPLFAITRAAA